MRQVISVLKRTKSIILCSIYILIFQKLFPAGVIPVLRTLFYCISNTNGGGWGGKSSNLPTYFSLTCIFLNVCQEVISSILTILAGICLQLMLRTTLSRRVLLHIIFISQMGCLESSSGLNIGERLLIPPSTLNLPLLISSSCFYVVLLYVLDSMLCYHLFQYCSSKVGAKDRGVHRIGDFDYRANKKLQMLRKNVQDKLKIIRLLIAFCYLIKRSVYFFQITFLCLDSI